MIIVTYMDMESIVVEMVTIKVSVNLWLKIQQEGYLFGVILDLVTAYGGLHIIGLIELW